MKDWRQIQKENFTSLKEISIFLELDAENQDRLVKRPFPLVLPRRLAHKIAKNSLTDPIGMQFLPLDAEMLSTNDFIANPLKEKTIPNGPKLLHKYSGRVLLLVSGACAMHCRYCFRQNHPYESSTTPPTHEIHYIRSNPSIHEVILSGGDPLSLSDASLKTLFDELNAIDHVKLIRFHTRFPIGIPERICDSFLEILKNSPKQIVFVVHTNHPKELDADIFLALKKLQTLGIPVFTQTVLLKGINDNVEALKELFLTLSTNGIIPYYLHQLDRVQGANHFEVPIAKGLSLMNILRTQIPGYALPQYVQEIPGEQSKTRLN